MKQRLFIAIPIPEEIKKKIINNTKLPDNFRLTKPQNLHITILFLGDTDEIKIKEITNKLEKIIKNYNSFELEISKFDQFPASGYPKIIYLTGENGRNKLLKLANEIRINLKKIGFSDNKNFKYHITIARQKFKNQEQIILPEIKSSFIFQAEKVILYKSDLKPGGPEYTPIWDKKLTN